MRLAMQEFAWHAHPAAERTGFAVAASAVVLATTAAIYVSFETLAWSGLGLVVLVAALNRFFFPSRFRIDAEGITARFPLRTQRFRWLDVRPFSVDEHGGYLSTRARRSRLRGELGRDRQPRPRGCVAPTRRR